MPVLNGETGLNENEPYWAGLVIAAIMLGSGFSLLLFPVFTGYGAIIMSLGIMTIVVVLMTKALIIQVQKWMDYNARIEETVANILALRKQVVPAQSQGNTSQRDQTSVQAENEEEIAAVA